MFRTDDPTDALSAAWGIKEQLRRLLSTDTLAQAWQERMRMALLRPDREHARDDEAL